MTRRLSWSWRGRSLPVLGAWIEILKRKNLPIKQVRRSLYWERGLKFRNPNNYLTGFESLPVLGAWIEIGIQRN